MKSRRVSLGLTQGEVARRLGYSSPQFISNIERGICSPPLSSLKRLSQIYDIHHKELISLILDEQERVLSEAMK